MCRHLTGGSLRALHTAVLCACAVADSAALNLLLFVWQPKSS